MRKVVRIGRYFLVPAFLLAQFSCTTKKNTATTRAFHNLTSRFNGYFHANERLKEGVKKLEKDTPDDFSQILPVFVYASKENVKTFYPDMELVIDKASKCIQRHAIVDRKNIEIPGAVKWIDDCYLVIGKAHFYKQEYFKSLEMFEYITKQYKKDPIRFQAQLWMVRAYNEMGSIGKAEAMIDQMKSDKKFPKELKPELQLVSADFHMKRQGYDAVLNYLSKATKETRKRRTKARYNFIMAQIYQQKGDNKKALELYRTVISQKPYYDMEFNARMKLVQLYDGSSKKGKGLKKELLKMLKDDKNIEYRDQIYYALAEIASKENDKKLAKEYLNKSLASALKNKKQKAMSFMRLADIYFDEANYTSAQSYYDSTLTVLDKEHPDYDKVYAKRDNLTELVKNIQTAAKEDSLLTLSEKDSVSIYAVIDAIIKKVEEDEILKTQQAENAFNAAQNQGQPDQIPVNTIPGQPQQGGAAWYFYNVSATSIGYNDFIRKWGNRQPEDDWRRSNKQSAMVIATEQNTSSAPSDLTVNKTSDKKSRNYYLQDLPSTPSQKKAAHDKIEEAWYNLGFIYREKLSNNEKAAESFEEVIDRYPQTKRKPVCYYQLFRTYLALSDDVNADKYKKLLLNEYPESEFARIINNPNYGKETMASRNEVEEFYSETYQYFAKGDYATVIMKCRYADSVYSNNFLMPKFDYLNAMCMAHAGGEKAYVSSLKQLAVKYPKDEVGLKAQEMIDLLEMKNAPVDTIALARANMYKYIPNDELYYVMVVSAENVDINGLKALFSEKNNTAFSTLQLNVSSIMFNDSAQMIVIKSFSDRLTARSYYEYVRDSEDLQGFVGDNTLGSFLISAINYSVFYKDKDIQFYEEFFTKNYLD